MGSLAGIWSYGLTTVSHGIPTYPYQSPVDRQMMAGWEKVSPLPVARAGCGAAVTGGQLYVVGGFHRAPGSSCHMLGSWGLAL